jgi:hypothetical protein
MSFLVLADEHDAIRTRVLGEAGKMEGPQDVANTYSSSEWLRKAFRTVRDFASA